MICYIYDHQEIKCECLQVFFFVTNHKCRCCDNFVLLLHITNSFGYCSTKILVGYCSIPCWVTQTFLFEGAGPFVDLLVSSYYGCRNIP